MGRPLTPRRRRGPSWRGLQAGAILLVLTAPAAAQPTQPVYVQYDGYLENDDGSLTLAFGYHNLNQVEVAIDAGDENRFLAGAADRGQPTTFTAGRRRFACVMVVPANFDGNLQWEVVFAGHTSTTTAAVLNPLYALEEGSARLVVEGLERNGAPPGVCLNR